jgi:hypothetical protein
MNHRLLISLGFLLAAAFGAPNQALAQKGKPSADVPGVAQFRCPSGIDCTPPPADGIQTASALIGFGSGAETGQGAFLNGSNGELWIGFGESVYGLDLHFTQLQGAAPCAATSSCRLLSPTVQVFATDGEFQSNALGPDDGDEPAANGLLDVSVGRTWRSRLKVSFSDPWGRGLLWVLNFNTIDYAEASNINVTRTGACTWEFEPGPDDVGGLSAWGNSAKGKRVRTDEGLYIMPFKITFSVQSC